MPDPTWTEQEIREAYDHASTAGVCEDADDIISALHYRFICAAHGCRNRATGMRKSYVSGWADEPHCDHHGTSP